MEIEQCSIKSPMGEVRNKDFKHLLEFNKNEYIPYLYLWDTLKAVLREKFIALSAYIKYME